MQTRFKHRNLIAKLFMLSAGLSLLAAVWLGVQSASASSDGRTVDRVSPLHPTFALLDEEGVNVLESEQPLSTMQTCGQCHDTEFIVSHSYHADLGLSDASAPGTAASGRDWDTGPGLLGKWNPLTYRYLSVLGDERLDMGTPEWLMAFGTEIVGGGPAVASRRSVPLESLGVLTTDPETSLLAGLAGDVRAWDWEKSGTLEMDCFLCHLPEPNSDARAEAIRSGDFRSASTATLLGIGLVEITEAGLAWNHAAFDGNGQVQAQYVLIQDPENSNCAQCHPMAHTGDAPLVIEAMDWQSAVTGQVVSPQRISNSGMNISDKQQAARSWDVHAERQLKCVECHFSLNNPAHDTGAEAGSEHLLYDPRRVEIGEYLERPSHNFARGQSAEDTVAPELKGSMRRCESCHEAASSHANWLPYFDRHVAVLACETCHIPQMFAPAIQSNDYTVVTPGGQASLAYRGIELGSPAVELASLGYVVPPTVNNLVTGYQPVLLQRRNVDGDTLLAPYNLVTSFFWVYEDANGNVRPVRLLDLEAAWLENGQYAPEILSAFDADGSGALDQSELAIDTSAKETLIANRLQAQGLKSVRIVGEIQPYSINHSVAGGENAVRDCETCHGDQSRILQPIRLSGYAPGGVQPVFVQDTNVNLSGEIVPGENGALYYQPLPANDRLYVFGSSRVNWIDWFGALALIGTVFGVAGHSTLRYVSSKRRPKVEVQVETVYMYDAYERFWHWLQTFTIVLLLSTGLVIHRPDMFGAFSFLHMVTVHNVLAAILAINALLSLFWHLVSGEIRQYIPRPRGFVDEAVEQALFYVRGIFKGQAHPFEKRKDKKLNPLQQATYFGLLNVLLPLQGITGILMWGVQRWPEVSGLFGGLPVLAPFHSLVAWLFGAFIIGHVYLTTTGATPLESMRGMITGWEDVEIHAHEEEEIEGERDDNHDSD